MSKDDSTGGFLSKVVKFVRHPTTSWADLDTRQSDRESEYSKAALKEMIERKRRNDFVRKREFDMLRKIRSREGTPAEAQGMRPSFFQSSLPSKPDDRAMTLKKIDEIEAQMSMQWWKTKGADSITSTGSSGLNTTSQGPGARARDKAGSASAPQVDPARLKAQYDVTEPAPLVKPASATSHAPTTPMALTPEKPSSTARTGLMAPRSGSASSTQGASFSASHFYALDVQEVAQDPEVEEAAIRFANGDDPGAEQGLLDALAENGPRVNQEADWLALFDLYRATGQLAAFESRAVDFVNRFDRSAPQWYDMPAQVQKLLGNTDEPTAATSSRAVWVCEAELDAHAIGTLQNVLGRAKQPWVIDWSLIESMDAKAARALLGMVTLWTDQDVELRFGGGAHLRDLLKSMTPSGRRDVEQLWWELRMALLRLMNRVDEFELTALDFCVTYELSPPGWEKPRCRYQSVRADGDEGGHSVLGESVIEAVSSTLSGESIIDTSQGVNHLGLVELSGEIRGDAQSTIDMLEQRLTGADVLILSCRNLIRVDFSAAGTLLNWVTDHHAQGRLVQFVDVHRLVSAFFHVVGITEYAKVVLRND
ncbi:MAG: STAS domain-containing protein [Hydrogenophaga sp.]|uniref:STAS domain-containing protein n=1 Tax=Hydrogenophaga sp. TaxID=1904254 RepID=UPI001D971145|nr:STAS domain-containing protein [Hydrogenophaga sp.]MBX3610630.1 STAS domain-containing protein [Hydrogenophaga sp.]